MEQLTKSDANKISEIMSDPVKWAQLFVITYDANLKTYTPWTARWYQVKMLRDKSLKKVARCGRRTGKTDTMCIDALHKAFTKPNFVVLFVTPYENQIRLIFTRLKELIANSPALKDAVVKSTQSPFNITLNNNARILGFTTGASSGSGAASVKNLLNINCPSLNKFEEEIELNAGNGLEPLVLNYERKNIVA